MRSTSSYPLLLEGDVRSILEDLAGTYLYPKPPEIVLVRFGSRASFEGGTDLPT